MCYVDEEKAKLSIPPLRLLLQDPLEIRQRARKVIQRLRKRLAGMPGVVIEVAEDVSQAGGGSLPEVAFKTFVVTLSSYAITVNALENRLRSGTPPIITRIKDDRVVLDMRTVRDHEIDIVVQAVARALTPH
mgnify:CR=1 FL=1